MQDFERTTVWYCKYGDTRAKTTDIWTNNLYNLLNSKGWNPRPECFNGNKDLPSRICTKRNAGQERRD